MQSEVPLIRLPMLLIECDFISEQTQMAPLFHICHKIITSDRQMDGQEHI